MLEWNQNSNSSLFAMNCSVRKLSTLAALCLIGPLWVAKIVRAENPKQSQVLIQADSQTADPKTNSLNARGNVFVSVPQYRLDVRADEAQYSETSQTLILIGNVRLVQRGNVMKGTRIICQLKTGQCEPQPG
jgi:lipopolysaccharide assembly outer membrane protein LptD (OstA)